MTAPEHVIYSGHPERHEVSIIGAGKTRDLDPRTDVSDYESAGFIWGRSGAGASQLALALLMDATKKQGVALHYVDAFKREIVAKWPRGRGWSITRKFIFDWLERRAEGTRLRAQGCKR